jgi:GTP pyrophosphokinase
MLITERLWTWEDLEQSLKNHYKNPQIARVRSAYDFAAAAHEGVVRFTGAPYIIHPLATAVRLADMSLPISIVMAGLLHDVPEDTDRTLDDIRAQFGHEVAELVNGVTKLGKVKYRGIDRYAENLRKMFLAMAADIRVVFIKFADRLHNLETLEAMPEHKRGRVAKEVLEIYAPIASRLGMGEIKGRMEDIAFRYADPDSYARAKALYDEEVRHHEEDIRTLIDEAATAVKEANIRLISIHGRRKGLYSYWQKLGRYHYDTNKVYDVVAVRLVVETISDCYAVLGLLHGRWSPLRGRIKDYIAQPKPNGYQSLHTTVLDDGGHIVEFQIRTKEMHEKAEFGIAAHWHYKDDSSEKPAPSLPWMQDIVNIQKELTNGKDFLKRLDEVRLDMFNNRIFVFTPKGDVIDLPEGSTPIDFAYAIHSQVGDKCVGAMVNNNTVTLDTALKSGDMCSILIDKKRKGPNPDWIPFARTHQARAKIRAATRSTVKRWIDAVIGNSSADI